MMSNVFRPFWTPPTYFVWQYLHINFYPTTFNIGCHFRPETWPLYLSSISVLTKYQYTDTYTQYFDFQILILILLISKTYWNTDTSVLFLSSVFFYFFTDLMTMFEDTKIVLMHFYWSCVIKCANMGFITALDCDFLQYNSLNHLYWLNVLSTLEFLRLMKFVWHFVIGNLYTLQSHCFDALLLKLCD